MLLEYVRCVRWCAHYSRIYLKVSAPINTKTRPTFPLIFPHFALWTHWRLKTNDIEMISLICKRSPTKCGFAHSKICHASAHGQFKQSTITALKLSLDKLCVVRCVCVCEKTLLFSVWRKEMGSWCSWLNWVRCKVLQRHSHDVLFIQCCCVLILPTEIIKLMPNLRHSHANIN